MIYLIRLFWTVYRVIFKRYYKLPVLSLDVKYYFDTFEYMSTVIPDRVIQEVKDITYSKLITDSNLQRKAKRRQYIIVEFNAVFTSPGTIPEISDKRAIGFNYVDGFLYSIGDSKSYIRNLKLKQLLDV